MKTLLFALMVIFTFTACSKRIVVDSFEPAKITKASNVKKISVMKLTNDSIGFSEKLEKELSKKNVLGKPYFTVINREGINRILDEQKLQYSGLVNKQTVIKIGQLIGVTGIITGEIIDTDVTTNYYRKSRVKCIDKECKKTEEYLVFCKEFIYNLSVNVKLSSIEEGTVIYADSISKENSFNQCNDQTNRVPSFNLIMEDLSDQVVKQFLTQIAPTQKSFSVELLEEPEIDYNEQQETLLEYALLYIENNRLLKAEELLSKLLTSTDDKCHVAAYNLGVIKEAQKEYTLAKNLYYLADNLTKTPHELIDKAVIRIGTQIKNFNIVKQEAEK